MEKLESVKLGMRKAGICKTKMEKAGNGKIWNGKSQNL
jgi:hypothetical protein